MLQCGPDNNKVCLLCFGCSLLSIVPNTCWVIGKLHQALQQRDQLDIQQAYAIAGFLFVCLPITVVKAHKMSISSPHTGGPNTCTCLF